MFESFLLNILLGVVLAVIPAHIAHTKGRNPLLWLLYALFLWPFALIHSLFLSPNSRAEGYTICKYCTGVVSNLASKCMHCGSDIGKSKMPEGAEGIESIPSYTTKDYTQIISTEYKKDVK